MRVVKYIFIIIVALIAIIGAAIAVFLYSNKPDCSGEKELEGINRNTEILFDNYGIPHIYAENANDAYFAMGYIHASERLFQMEMMRRVASGHLSEILGSSMIKTDRFFKTLGIERIADESVKQYLSDSTKAWQKATYQYIAGVNAFIESGKTPIEFYLIGMPKTEFTVKDVYMISGLMALSFANGFTIDPVISRIQQQYGDAYLKDLAIKSDSQTVKLPIHRNPPIVNMEGISKDISEIINSLPFQPFIGSNGWLVAPSRSESGKALFANDTHIGYSQPAVWYETHIEYPDCSFYGSFIPGIPFALVGHSHSKVWGLTMFENDDVNFYREKANPQNPDQVWVNDHWEDLKIVDETITVKDSDNVQVKVRYSRHGAIINDVFDGFSKFEKEPVSVWWIYTQFPSRAVEALYQLNHAENITDTRNALAMIDAPGLNFMYADIEGNIAWWAVAKLVKLPVDANTTTFLDGTSGKYEPTEFFSFDENPCAINPESGFVYTANNQPDTIAGMLYPGYYAPNDRAGRILDYAKANEKFSLETFKKIQADVVSTNFSALAHEIAKIVSTQSKLSGLEQQLADSLANWDGSHELTSVSATVFHLTLSYILARTFVDELGNDDFKSISSSHLMKSTLPLLLRNDSSVWWDNILTSSKKESRTDIFASSFLTTVQQLSKDHGTDIKNWQWANVHQLTHGHAIGEKKPFDKIFNVGPFPQRGGNETINNLAFNWDTTGVFKIKYGPAIRILLDFSDVEHSQNVIPSGQSGHFMSEFYDNQAELYNANQYRLQMMNRDEIVKNTKYKMMLK